MAEVIEINELEQLRPFRMAWNALLPQTPRASFFHSYDWLVRFWHHFGAERRFRILAIRSCGDIIGIVPLCVQQENFQVGALRVLTYPLSDWGVWYGPIGPNQSASMFMAMQHLRKSRRDWDVAELRWVDSGRSDRSGANRAMQVAGLTPQKSLYQQTSIVEICDSWDEYLSTRSSKWRHEIRRQQRAVESLGDVEFIRHRPRPTAEGDGEPRWDLLAACLQIAKNSWQGSSETGNTLSHDAVRNFLHDCHEDAARLGMLDLAMLRVDGQPAAFVYNYHHQGNVFGLRMGYDAHVSNRGLGTALLSRVLQDSHDRGDHRFDLGVGEYDFKRRFRTTVETSYQYSHFPRLAWRSQGLRLSRWIKRQIQPPTTVAPISKSQAS